MPAAGWALIGGPRVVALTSRLPRPSDPGLTGLRRASRAAFLTPTLFALTALVIGQPELATFTAFGTFALVVMADFGGPAGPRAGAYAATVGVGGLLIALGTLVSPLPWSAAAAMLGVGFAVQLTGVFGGYAAAARIALLLAFVLAATIPASAADLLPRLGGWALAGAAALPAGVLLWPRYERRALRGGMAAACRAIAALVEAGSAGEVPAGELARRREEAAEAVEAVRRRYAATPHRPAGPTRRDRALAELTDELGRALKFARPGLPAGPVAALPEHRALAAAVIDVLRASGEILAGRPAELDVGCLEQRRRADRAALDRWAAARLRAGAPGGTVLDGLESGRPARILSYLALAIGENAAAAAGVPAQAQTAAPELTAGAGPGAFEARVTETLRTHLAPSSIWFQSSLRAAAGLALAVLVARLVGLEHAFWTVFGTISVLRSNAVGTGRSALAAVAGTTVGLLVSSPLLLAVGHDPGTLWAILPAAVFVAAYAASALGFVLGQAGFTVMVVVLFNLVQPVGWRLGLTRIEDILVGVAISLVVGLVLWPRGARGRLRAALASLYRRDAGYLEAAFGRVLETGGEADEVPAARRLALAEAARAGEAFDQFLNERGATRLPRERWASLLAGGGYLLLAGDLLQVIFDAGYRAGGCREAAASVAREAQALVSGYRSMAEAIAGGPGGGQPPSTAVSAGEPERRAVSVACLEAWAGREGSRLGPAAIGLVSAADWVRQLGSLAEHLEPSVAALARLPARGG